MGFNENGLMSYGSMRHARQDTTPQLFLAPVGAASSESV